MREPLRYGRYLLLDRVDVGGMAEVFAARLADGDGRGRLVAVKRLLPTLAEDPAAVAMFLDEARIAVQLDHPGIARVEDLGQHGASYFLAMEYVPGRPLAAVAAALARDGAALPVPLAAHLGVRVLEALHHAHRRCDPAGRPLGVVHRDVSPHNVLVAFTGEVKLIDFGLARAGERGAPQEPGVVRGKLAYASPEQAAGDPVDARSDVFSAAVVIHELLTGRRLFGGAEVAARAAGTTPPPDAVRGEVPAPLAAAVMRALSPDPVRRPHSAAELADALRPHAASPAEGRAALAALLQRLFPEELAREAARAAEA